MFSEDNCRVPLERDDARLFHSSLLLLHTRGGASRQSRVDGVVALSQCVQVKYCICEVYVLLWSLIYLHACARIQLCCLILMGIVYYSWIFRFINDLHLYFFVIWISCVFRLGILIFVYSCSLQIIVTLPIITYLQCHLIWLHIMFFSFYFSPIYIAIHLSAFFEFFSHFFCVLFYFILVSIW